MRPRAGLLAILAGVALLLAGLVWGLPFSAIYLLGFIGTGGREAGREVLLFLPSTLLVLGAGVGLVVLGDRWRRPRRD